MSIGRNVAFVRHHITRCIPLLFGVCLFISSKRFDSRSEWSSLFYSVAYFGAWSGPVPDRSAEGAEAVIRDREAKKSSNPYEGCQGVSLDK